MSTKINMSILLCFFALNFSTSADARPCKKYCYMPCKTTLSGHLHIKNMSLNDPVKHFASYVLVLSAKIEVPESGPFDGVAGEDHVQLDFFRLGKNFKEGDCINVSGELTGPITASDNYNLIMQVDSVVACKNK